MQATALIVEFLIPGLLLLAGLAGIADVLLDGRIWNVVFSKSPFNVVGQVVVSAMVLSLAYALGIISSMQLYRVPILRRWYRNIALTTYEEYKEKLSYHVEKSFGFKIPDSDEVSRKRAELAEDLYDTLWGYLRNRFPMGLDEYKFGVGLERLCRGYIIASPFVVLAVILESGRLASVTDVSKTAIWWWVVGGIAAVLVGLALLAVHLLRYAVKLEYTCLTLIFLGERREGHSAELLARRKEEGAKL